MNTTTNPLNAPTSPMTIRVKIDDIQPFDRDPRRAPNEKYERIRESIRAVGLHQQISITKRPHEDHYIVRSGGNTRLKALKELYAETAEERFSAIECRFVPYTNDIELLRLHIEGNECYGEMLFIDVAMAVKKFKGMIESKTGQTISLHQLDIEMRQRGWVINQQNLPYYIYATEIENELSIAFAHGLNREYVRLIKALGRRAERWANEKNIDINQCILVFKNTLKKNDGKLISLSAIEKDLFERLSSTFKLNFDDVQNDFILIRDKETPTQDGATNNG